MRRAPAHSIPPLRGKPSGRGLCPRLAAIGQGLVPHLAPPGMLRQPFHLVVPPLARQCLQRRNDTGMQRAPPLVEQTPIGHLMREGVLEGIGALGKQAGLVEELGRLELRQAASTALRRKYRR